MYSRRLCAAGLQGAAYRFDYVGAVGQPSDVDLGLHHPADRGEQALRTVDVHYSLPPDLHTDAAVQLIHRDLNQEVVEAQRRQLTTTHN